MIYLHVTHLLEVEDNVVEDLEAIWLFWNRFWLFWASEQRHKQTHPLFGRCAAPEASVPSLWQVRSATSKHTLPLENAQRLLCFLQFRLGT